MTVVVSDTAPLNNLILIGEVEILPRLFGQIVIPPAVSGELQHPKAPRAVAEWAGKPPGRLEVRKPMVDLHLGIGLGEDEAISLAVELGNAALLSDDRKACAAARQRRLTAIGTLTILDLADEAGLLEFEAAITRLKATNFYVDDFVLEPIIAAVRGRKRAS